jgi:ATP-dependent RNA helicase RhlE
VTLATIAALPVDKKIISNLQALGYSELTPIQQQAIEPILRGEDLLAAAQTGTGKTAAFGIPMAQMLLQSDVTLGTHPKMLVLTPTRELAVQVFESLQSITQDTGIKSVVVYGGVSFGVQVNHLKAGCDILIATPGRLLDHLFKRTVSLDELNLWVLDEADRMLDLGFKPDIQRITRKIPNSIQTLYFSATYKKNVRDLAHKLLNTPTEVTASQENSVSVTLEERVYQIDKHKKPAALAYLIGSKNWQQVLVFVKTKQGAEQLIKQLKLDGIQAESFHGDKSQGARSKALEQFKQQKIRALVATDVAARGIDVRALDQVINYDMPFKAEDYVHRVGRTGRAGREGLAVSFVTRQDEAMLESIEQLIDRRLGTQWLEGFEPNFTSPNEASEEVRPPRRRSKSKEKAKLKKKLGY